MHSLRHIITKIFVRRFYAQNSGFFLFLFVIFFGIVHGGMLPVYHYELIMGMLSIQPAFFLVLFLWLLYFLKCAQFVSNTLSVPETSFLNILNQLPSGRVFFLFLGVQVFLYLPVLAYSSAIIVIAFYHHFYTRAGIIILFHGMVCFAGADWFRRMCRHSGLRTGFFLPKWRWRVPKPYFSFLLAYLFNDLKYLFFGIKIFSCFLLYIFLSRLEQNDYDLRMLMMIYTMSLLGHGIIIHRTRELEETRMVFYRQLPVPRWKRWMQYVVFYVFIAIPEMVVIAGLVPLPLHTRDGVYILLFTVSLLLLLHAILSSVFIPMKQFLKIAFGIFVLVYFFVLAGAVMPMIVLLFGVATGLFMRGYYRFELLI